MAREQQILQTQQRLWDEGDTAIADNSLGDIRVVLQWASEQLQIVQQKESEMDDPATTDALVVSLFVLEDLKKEVSRVFREAVSWYKDELRVRTENSEARSEQDGTGSE